MTIKELKEIIGCFPDEFEVGHYTKEDQRTHNLQPAYWVDVFHKFDNINVDIKNKRVIFITE